VLYTEAQTRGGKTHYYRTRSVRKDGKVGKERVYLHKNGFPMINIQNRRKRDHYSALHKAQVDEDLRPLIERVLDAYKKSRLSF